MLLGFVSLYTGLVRGNDGVRHGNPALRNAVARRVRRMRNHEGLCTPS